MKRSVVLIALLTSMLLVSQATLAQRFGSRDEPRYRDNGGQSLESAVSRARERSGGRVLSAETREKDGKREHVIRILTDKGKVKRYRYQADSNGKDRRR